MKTASELRSIFLDTCEEFEIDASDISIKFIDKIYSDIKQSILTLVDDMIDEQLEQLNSKRLTGCGRGAVSMSIVKLRELKARIIKKFELE